MHPVSAMQSALRHGFCGPSSPYLFTYTYTTASSPSRDRVRSRDWQELALIQIGIGIVHFSRPARLLSRWGRKMFDPDSDPDPDFDVYSQRRR